MNARPTKFEPEKRSNQVIFKCSDIELEELNRLTMLYGYANRADFIRRVCLGYEQVDRTKLESKEKP